MKANLEPSNKRTRSGYLLSKKQGEPVVNESITVVVKGVEDGLPFFSVIVAVFAVVEVGFFLAF